MACRSWLYALAAASHYVAASTAAGQSVAVERCVLNGHTSSVLAIGYSPDGKLLASAGADKTIRLWNPTTGEATAVLEGHHYIAKSIAFTPDGRTLMSGAGQFVDGKFAGEIKIWEMPSGRIKRTISMKPNNDVNAIACFPNGKLIASGGIEGISVWDIETGELRRSLPTDNSAALALAVSQDGQTLVSGSFDALVRLWDTRTWKVKQTLTEHRSEIRGTKLSADGKTLATYTGGRKEADLWDLEAGRLKRTISNRYDIESLAIAPDGRTLATAGDRLKSTTGRVSLWDVSTGEHRGTIEESGGAVFAMEFSPNGKMLATGGNAKAIKLWEVSK